MALQLFERLVVGPLACNCYLVGDPATRDAIVIDPGDQPDDILEAVARHGLHLVAAVATHAHLDHVLGAEAIRQRAAVPFLLHADDLPLLAVLREAGPEPAHLPEVDRRLADGDELSAGSLRLGVPTRPATRPAASRCWSPTRPCSRVTRSSRTPSVAPTCPVAIRFWSSCPSASAC